MQEHNPQIDERRLQRELRFICIMGQQPRRPASAPSELVNLGLIDETGFVTPKGKQFMLNAAQA